MLTNVAFLIVLLAVSAKGQTEPTAEPTICGEDFTAETGSFTSPDYPENYPVVSRCEWTIAAPEGKVVALTFDDFQVGQEEIPYCRHYDDSLTIHGGNQYLSTICGQLSTPLTIASDNSNTMELEFWSSAEVSEKGFSASYKFIDACGGVFDEESGTFGTPDIDVAELRCVWTFNAPEGYRVKFDFGEVTDVDTEGCGDYFKFSGTERYCGKDLPKLVETEKAGPSILELDTSITANYATIPKFTASYTFVEAEPTLTASVGGVYVEPGLITTETFRIQAPEGQVVQLNINTIGFYNKFNCQRYSGYTADSYLDLYSRDADGQNDHFLHYCLPVLDTAQTSWASTTNEMVVYYKAIDEKSSGLSATYKFIDCGGSITEEGVLTSPNYPEPYPNNLDCTWNIEAPEGKYVRVEFVEMEWPVEDTCGDRIWFTTEVTSKHVCRRDAGPMLFHGFYNKLDVRFTTTDKYTARGWYAKIFFDDFITG